ncbi:type II toxin-antitoxin system VapB family antitoxin [Agromyces seonyuensis]|uniref:AbrB/MazE/SpoVT family DNA-binding domain-containing protein n=1 Tax=Agromyces seonyuensis TaxID=2662446 RepID=A0A6I4P059_9MICO|nr:AbrB/MazE/SpoVT family DNA-binding domain-containing protein [Agromyces seonyuensis]
MIRTTVFKNNRTQAVRLPKDVAFGDDVKAVDILVVGDARVVTPAGGAVDYWFDHAPLAPDDFLTERDQGVAEERGWA